MKILKSVIYSIIKLDFIYSTKNIKSVKFKIKSKNKQFLLRRSFKSLIELCRKKNQPIFKFSS